MGNNTSSYSIEQIQSAEAVTDVDPFIKQMLADKMRMPYSAQNDATEVMPCLYLGDHFNAEDVPYLRSLGITHVINTAEDYIDTGAEDYIDTGAEYYSAEDIEYLGFASEDDDVYDIMQHFDEVFEFIEKARKSGGKAFIHCLAGVNRSGALAVAYYMVQEQVGPVKASRYVRNLRGRLLSNDSFQQQLVFFAKERNLLVKDIEELKKST